MSASLSDEEIEDRFYLLGRMEILKTLRDLIARHETLTVYFNSGKDFILTTLLDVRQDALIFDLGSDEKANRRLVQSPSCVFVCAPDGVRVQFTGMDPGRISWTKSDVFWTPCPDRIIRMQRRENFRTVLPIMKSLQVRVSDEQGQELGVWSLKNMSIAGAGAVLPSGFQRDLVGVPVRCDVLLGDQLRFACSGQVRHESTEKSSIASRTIIGLELTNVEHATQVDIQRFLMKLEIERHKLLAH
ncbi:MAG: flagellar brake protein [Burkholderiaceae bacterium]|nr:flagellar brake protein [Burkholderiaceae bacterium]